MDTVCIREQRFSITCEQLFNEITLRTFALIVRILTAHANIHATSCIERALSTIMNIDRADGHCYSYAWI